MRYPTAEMEVVEHATIQIASVNVSDRGTRSLQPATDHMMHNIPKTLHNAGTEQPDTSQSAFEAGSKRGVTHSS